MDDTDDEPTGNGGLGRERPAEESGDLAEHHRAYQARLAQREDAEQKRAEAVYERERQRLADYARQLTNETERERVE
ncbi:MAG: hypothetical protein GEV09_26225, partial [Pseudonocardiaceae bacterium]|nr:hypothetical protein [Pseudonocardiaceae bacterium]